jgi:hypothetical protein
VGRFVSFQNHLLTWCYVPPTVRHGVSNSTENGVYLPSCDDECKTSPMVSRRHDCRHSVGSGNTRRKVESFAIPTRSDTTLSVLADNARPIHARQTSCIQVLGSFGAFDMFRNVRISERCADFSDW